MSLTNQLYGTGQQDTILVVSDYHLSMLHDNSHVSWMHLKHNNMARKSRTGGRDTKGSAVEKVRRSVVPGRVIMTPEEYKRLCALKKMYNQ